MKEKPHTHTHTNGATFYENADLHYRKFHLPPQSYRTLSLDPEKSNDTPYVILSITSAQVLAMLQKKSPRKAAGIDNISAQLLRIACEHTLRHLFYPGETIEFAHRNFIF